MRFPMRHVDRDGNVTYTKTTGPIDFGPGPHSKKVLVVEQMWYFTVPGPPVPKARPRVVHKDRRGRLLAKPRTFTPKTTKVYEDKVAKLALKAGIRRIPAPRRVGLSVVAYLPDNSAMDLDNVYKCIGDSLNGVAYDDDKQIWDGRFSRRTDNANPRIEVTLREVVA